MHRLTALSLLAGMLATSGMAPAGAQTEDVQVVLELSQRFYYAGAPFPVRISIGNDGSTKIANPIKTRLFKAFEVRSEDGQLLEATDGAAGSEPSRPDKLAPGTFYGAIVDLTKIYPQLLEPGRFEIRWAADGYESDTIVVRMIREFDPTKDYWARVETSHGTIVVELMKETAPLAVKNFVDLANSDFYDGLPIYDIRPELFVVGGAPSGYTYPAELARVPVVAGTVLMKPASPSPPANGAEFIIALRPEPTWTGQFTVVGQVIDGLETVRNISKLPSTGSTANPAFQPLKEIKIRNVDILERSDETATPGPGSG